MIERKFDSTKERRRAVFSDCEQYRYLLEILWDARPPLQFIGLNPSTADEFKNDMTVARCCKRAEKLGCGGLLMTNLFAFRARWPKVMRRQLDPVGPANDEMIFLAAKRSSLTIAAWGTSGSFLDREAIFLKRWRRVFLNRPMMALRLTKDGNPEHPLYLPYYLVPVPYEGLTKALHD